MRRFTPALMLMTIVLSATVATAQVRGKGRVQGNVVEQGTGKPVDGAKVTLAPASSSTAPIVTKTNAKGHWSALGLTGGQWNVDIEAAGFTTSRGTVNVSETQMIPPIRTQLARPVAAVDDPATPTVANVPQEVIDAIGEAQKLMAIAAGDVVTRTEAGAAGESSSVSHTVTADDVKENAKKAAALVATALPQIPSDTEERVKLLGQLKELLSQAYYKAGDVPAAVTVLKEVVAADPANTTKALLLTNLYLENSQLDQARALLANLPENAVTDPTVYVNIGILFMNKQNPAESVTYLSKAIALDAARAETYYYRGLANLQLKKDAEAKSDFAKVLELAPDSSEGRDARQLLDGLK